MDITSAKKILKYKPEFTLKKGFMKLGNGTKKIKMRTS